MHKDSLIKQTDGTTTQEEVVSHDGGAWELSPPKDNGFGPPIRAESFTRESTKHVNFTDEVINKSD